jgi:hypothetical protein
MMAPGAVIECDDGARRVADGELPWAPVVLTLYRATAALSHEQSATTHFDALSDRRVTGCDHLGERLRHRSVCHAAA